MTVVGRLKICQETLYVTELYFLTDKVISKLSSFKSNSVIFMLPKH